jgi:hypothetical protein
MMGVMRVLLLLFLSACAANQAALPVAPPFNPAMDAPITVGQPGHVAPPKPERSPHARTLPQTDETRREDGLWAGDALKVATVHSGPDDMTVTLMEERMVLPEAHKDALPVMRFCAAALTTPIARLGVVPQDMKLRHCLAPYLLVECIGEIEAGAVRHPFSDAQVAAARAIANDIKAKRCSGALLRPGVADFADDIIATWRRFR